MSHPPAHAGGSDLFGDVAGGNRNVAIGAEGTYRIARIRTTDYVPHAGRRAEDRDVGFPIAVEVRRSGQVRRKAEQRRAKTFRRRQKVPDRIGRTENSDVRAAVAVVIALNGLISVEAELDSVKP